MSNSKKRKFEVSENDGLFIGIARDQLKNKNYIEVPSTLECTTFHEEYLFTYDKKKYYPITIMKPDGSQMIRRDVKLQLTLEIIRDDIEESSPDITQTEEIACTSNGCYWYQSIIPAVSGSFTVIITCPKHPEIKEYRHEIKVKGKKTTIKAKDKIATISAEKVAKVSQQQSLTSFAFTSNNEKSIDDTQDNNGATKVTTTDFVEILPIPTPDIVYSVNNKLIRPNVESMEIGGAYMKMKLHASLVIALMDDNSRIKSLYTQKTHSSISSKDIQTHNIPILHTMTGYNSPTVHELLYRMQKDCKPLIAGSEEVFYLLRCLFEFYFEKYILYDIERQSEIYGEQIQLMKANKQLMSTAFGGIYLLRFLTFLVTRTESALNIHIHDHDETPITAAITATATVDRTPEDKVAAAAVTTAVATSSSTITPRTQSRRHNLNAKSLISASLKIQEVCVYICNELDVYSHFLFP